MWLFFMLTRKQILCESEHVDDMLEYINESHYKSIFKFHINQEKRKAEHK